MVRTGLIFLCVQGEKSCVHTQYASLSISLLGVKVTDYYFMLKCFCIKVFGTLYCLNIEMNLVYTLPAVRNYS